MKYIIFKTLKANLVNFMYSLLNHSHLVSDWSSESRDFTSDTRFRIRINKFKIIIKYIWIWQEVGQRLGEIHTPDRWPAHLITLNFSGYKYERLPSSSKLDSTLRTSIHHPATPVYRLESPVRSTPRGRTIRELLCGLVCYCISSPVWPVSLFAVYTRLE